MICQECKQKPATLHFTKIINGEKTEVHLCEKCSQGKSDILMIDAGSNFSISSILAGLLNIDQGFTSTQQNPFVNGNDIRCDHCHLSYSQFARVGKFGCSSCYDSFSKQLEPILKRLHGGNSTHTGKIPKRIGGNISLRKKINDLKQELQMSILQEEFENAAEIRDEIRSLEKEAKSSEERSDLL
ncbi:UvrB/UvrC motif-containing protein [Bacillus massiliigorillae]|uniref:UvrB/UvrC motif-containing protein n=1 Tax=Bacillus massiliigorillae TaxID=1243664 RepID=UPI0003A39349|nr:UvrB/UvrC motif-containing protein [Bacillus massiliigorillae]